MGLCRVPCTAHAHTGLSIGGCRGGRWSPHGMLCHMHAHIVGPCCTSGGKANAGSCCVGWGVLTQDGACLCTAVTIVSMVPLLRSAALQRFVLSNSNHIWFTTLHLLMKLQTDKSRPATFSAVAVGSWDPPSRQSLHAAFSACTASTIQRLLNGVML